MGLTLVVDVVVEQHDGSSYAVKNLPLAMGKGPPLWKWWMQLPEGHYLRHLLACMWPQYVDMGSAATISARLASSIQHETASDTPQTSTIGECNTHKVKHRLPTPWAAPPTNEKLSLMIRGARPSDLAKVLDDVPSLGGRHVPQYVPDPGCIHGKLPPNPVVFFWKSLLLVLFLLRPHPNDLSVPRLPLLPPTQRGLWHCVSRPPQRFRSICLKWRTSQTTGRVIGRGS